MCNGHRDKPDNSDHGCCQHRPKSAGCPLKRRLHWRLAFLQPFPDCLHQYETIEGRNTRHRNESDCSRDRKWHSTQPKCQGSPNKSQWDTSEDKAGLAERAQCHEQQYTDHDKHCRCHYTEPLLRTLQVFKLATPLNGVAGRQSDSLGNLGLCLGHKATQIPASNVGLDHHTAAAIVAADLILTLGHLNIGDG